MAMVSILWQEDLKTAEISRNPQTIDDVMAKIFSKLPRRSTPTDIAEAITGTRAGHLAVRVGLTPNFLHNISIDDPDQTEQVWQEAIEIWQDTKVQRSPA